MHIGTAGFTLVQVLRAWSSFLLLVPKKRWRDCAVKTTLLCWCVFLLLFFSFTFEDFGRIYDHSFPACAFFFFSKWKLAPRTLIHSLGQDQSTVAHLAETTVAGCSLTRRPYTYAFRKGLITVRSLKKKLKTKNPESYTTRAIALWIITVRPL